MSTKKIEVEPPEPRRPRVRRDLLIGATAALVVIVGVALVFVTGDGTEVAGSDSRLLQLTFDGEQCTYEGPSVLSAGEVEVVYHNESSESSWFQFVRLDEDKTLGEITDDFEDPSIVGRPRISANTSSIPTPWTVAPGFYILVCGTWVPYDAYFGLVLGVSP